MLEASTLLSPQNPERGVCVHGWHMGIGNECVYVCVCSYVCIDLYVKFMVPASFLNIDAHSILYVSAYVRMYV